MGSVSASLSVESLTGHVTRLKHWRAPLYDLEVSVSLVLQHDDFSQFDGFSLRTCLSLKVNGLLKKLVQTICKRVLKCGVKSRSNRLCRASYLNLQILRFLYNCLMWYRKSFTNTLPGVFRSTLCRSFHFPPTFEGLWPRKEISPWINNDCLVWTILWMDPQMWCQTQVIEQVVQGFPFLNLNILKFLFLWCDTIASPFAKFFARSIQVNSMHELPFFSYIWGFAVLKKSYSFKNCIIVLWTICGRILKYGV